MILDRQLDESTVKDDEMDGFMLHLQNEQKEAIIKEEPSLHIYSSKDVDMWAVLIIVLMHFVCLVVCLTW